MVNAIVMMIGDVMGMVMVMMVIVMMMVIEW